jgi:hypothetical protein
LNTCPPLEKVDPNSNLIVAVGKWSKIALPLAVGKWSKIAIPLAVGKWSKNNL